MAQVERAEREVGRPVRGWRLWKSKRHLRWHVRTERKTASEQAAARVDDRSRDERAASGRRFNPAFRNQFCQRRKNGIAMHAKTHRELPAAGQPVPGTQASSLDLAGEGVRDLQEGRKRRVALDVDD